MVSVRVQVVCSLLLWAFFFLLVNNDVVTRIWPGAVAGGLKLLCLGLAPVLLGLMGEKAVPKTALAPPAGKAPAPNAMHDKRPGVFAATCSEQRDTLWVRLAPNEEYVGRDAYTGRATGVFAQRPVAHDVDDSPKRPWIPAWLNMIRPWRDWDAPWYGKSVGLRYADRAHKTGTVFM